MRRLKGDNLSSVLIRVDRSFFQRLRQIQLLLANKGKPISIVKLTQLMAVGMPTIIIESKKQPGRPPKLSFWDTNLSDYQIEMHFRPVNKI